MRASAQAFLPAKSGRTSIADEVGSREPFSFWTTADVRFVDHCKPGRRTSRPDNAVRPFWLVCGVGCDLTRVDDDVAGESAIEIGLDPEVEVIF